jgi:hypothetical protein
MGAGGEFITGSYAKTPSAKNKASVPAAVTSKMKWSQQSLFTKLCCGEPGSQIFPFNLFLFFWCTGG